MTGLLPLVNVGESNSNACHTSVLIPIGICFRWSRFLYRNWAVCLYFICPWPELALHSIHPEYKKRKGDQEDSDATLTMFNWRMRDYEGSLYDKINTFPNLIRQLCLSTTRKIGIYPAEKMLSPILSPVSVRCHPASCILEISSPSWWMDGLITPSSSSIGQFKTATQEVSPLLSLFRVKLKYHGNQILLLS